MAVTIPPGAFTAWAFLGLVVGALLGAILGFLGALVASLAFGISLAFVGAYAAHHAHLAAEAQERELRKQGGRS